MEEKLNHIVRYRVFIAVWLALVALTWITVAVALKRLGGGSIIPPLAIATAKASLVMYFFMHLRYEKGFLKAMIFIALATLAVLVWLVFSDVAYR